MKRHNAIEKILISIRITLNFIRCFPHLILFYLHKNRAIILADTLNWHRICGHTYKQPIGFIYLLGSFKEFRTLFYHRIGWIKYLIQFICRGKQNLHITAGTTIGEKLYIHIGFATVISAKSIGKNCKVYQQVTIGRYNGAPTILDNVTIFSGAIIVGDIIVGNNVVIGANATVCEDVPDNTTVYPPVSRKMIWKSISGKPFSSEATDDILDF